MTYNGLVFSWMNNLVAKPKFHTLVKKIPILNRLAAKDGRRIYDLVSGFVYSQVLLAMVELRLFKFLLSGKKNIRELSDYAQLDQKKCLRKRKFVHIILEERSMRLMTA